MVKSVYELDVYQAAYTTSLDIIKLTKTFPKTELYSLTNQMDRASRSICANLAEGFAKGHKYPAEFKRYALNALGSAEEMIVWLDYARDLDYLHETKTTPLQNTYRKIARQINRLIDNWNTKNA